MLNICIIDDEHLALQYLDLLCGKIEGVHIVGKFTDANALIKHIQSENVDAVFMDIHMPEIEGIELAEKLLNIQPSLHIVFVTAYNEYAVKAFELNAVDYILKPVQKNRLEQSIQRIIQKNNIKTVEAPMASVSVIKNLGPFQIYQGDQRIDIKWRTSKTKELFAYFIQNHKKAMLKSELTDLLWQQLPWEKAHAQLYSTVYQIRKVIQKASLPIKIISEGEFYHISVDGTMQVQANKFKHAAQEILKEKDIDVEQCFIVLGMYQGDYLAELDYPWLMEERNLLKKLWLQLITRVSDYLHVNEDTSTYSVSELKDIVSLDEEAIYIVQEKN